MMIGNTETHSLYDDRQYWNPQLSTSLNDPDLHSMPQLYEKASKQTNIQGHSCMRKQSYKPKQKERNTLVFLQIS